MDIMRWIFRVVLVVVLGVAPMVAAAQSEYGFKTMAVEEEFAENGFNYIQKEVQLFL